MKEIQTTIFKNDEFKTVGLAISCGRLGYHWGVISSPYTYQKTVTGKYYEEFVELYDLTTQKDLLKQFEHRFFDIAAATLGYDAIDGKGFNFEEERKKLAKIEARIDEIVYSIK